MVSASLPEHSSSQRSGGAVPRLKRRISKTQRPVNFSEKTRRRVNPRPYFVVSVIFAGRNSKYVSIRALDGAMSRVSHGYPPRSCLFHRLDGWSSTTATLEPSSPKTTSFAELPQGTFILPWFPRIGFWILKQRNAIACLREGHDHF